MRVWISKQDISMATPREPTMCPIARALGRKARPTDYVSVGTTTASVGKTHYRLSKAASAFVNKFDGGYRVKPCYVYMAEADI